MEIITNRQPRFLIDAYQLTEKERRDFDYLDWQAIDSGTECAIFVRYKGILYDIGEFTRVEKMPYWHGGIADSAFSGVLIHLCKDNDYVVMGRYYA